jgi:2-polyprenyl-3-methyl-5-hydroxy-6-metoxy-1,4-benzoquinol methylase
MDVYSFNTERYGETPINATFVIRMDKLVSLVGQGKTVLDLGCRDGAVGERLLQNQNIVYGVDASQNAVPKAIQKGIKAKVGNLEEGIDFPDDFFDVVLAGEIIEHIFEIDFLLAEVRRVLKNDGYFVLSTPNLASLGRRLMLLVNRNPHIEVSSKQAAGHVRYFVKHTLFELLCSHGFKVSHFTSDVVHLSASGKLRFAKLASLIPTLGASLIVKAQKKAQLSNTPSGSPQTASVPAIIHV